MNAPSPLASIPNDRSQRWALLHEVIGQWYPPLQSGDGVAAEDLDSAESRLGIAVPRALREWYSLAGSRKDVWSEQDHLLHPCEFRFNGDFLVFMLENQVVVEWGVRCDDLRMEDPPVYVSSAETPNDWRQENNSVSEFALHMFVYCLKWSHTCRWWANAHVTADVIDCVASKCRRLPFPTRHWPVPTQWFGDRDLIAEFQADLVSDAAWLYVVARTAAAADLFKDLVGPLNIEWKATSDAWPPGWVSTVLDP